MMGARLRTWTWKWTSVAAAAVWLCGCASYRYDVVAPAEGAGPVSGGDSRPFSIDPLRYAVGVEEDRLSIRIDNPTGQTIRLLGSRSAAVDPAGRSHPLIDQTMGPQSYVRVVLPPLRPWGGGGAAVSVPVGGPGVMAEPADVGGGGYDRASPVYWDWPGPGPVRVHLAYAAADGRQFDHDLAVERSAAR